MPDKIRWVIYIVPRMRRFISIFAIAGLIGWVAPGCSEKKIDTAKVRSTFQATSVKDNIEQACQMIDTSNYVGAIKQLKKIAYTAKLDKDQQLVLQDTLDWVQAKAAKQKRGRLIIIICWRILARRLY